MAYEEELCRSKEENQSKQQLQDKVLYLRIALIRGNVQIPTSPGPSLKQEITETPWIIEEPEEQSVKQEEEQLPVCVPESSAVCVKTEDSSLLQQRRTEHREETQEEDLCSEPDFYSETEGQTELSADSDNDDCREPPFSRSAAQMDREAAPETIVHNEDMSEVDGGAERKKLECPFCQKTFGTKQHLQNHIRVHTGEKPYSCSICWNTFTQKSHLESHKRIHTGDKPYSCTVCQKTFVRKSHLNLHKRTHTGEKPYRCPVCNKAFVQKCPLDVHSRTHTGEKPYSCTVCYRTFAQKCNLNTHMNTHSI